MSEILGSFSRGSSGPSPKISSRISRDNRSRSAKLRGTASLFTELRIRIRTSSRAVSLLVRPSFSRSRRSRIFRWRSALTCWYSLRSNACRFAMISLNCLEHRPGGALHVIVVLRKGRGQARERARDLGVVLLHHGNPSINGARNRKVLVWNAPQQRRPGGSLGVGFVKTRYFSKTVQHQLDAFLPVGFSQELHHPCRAPQGCHVGVRHQEHGFREISNQTGRGVHPRGRVHHHIAEVTHQHVEQTRKLGGGWFC